MTAQFLVAADYTDQAQVTNWPGRVALVVVVVLVLVLSVRGMRSGWESRSRRQGAFPALPPVPQGDAGFDASLLDALVGRYIGTTRADDWLDRIVAQGLGAPSRAELSVGPDGVWFARDGAPDLFVPASRVRGVRADRGLAGAVFEQGGVVVVTWDYADALVDSGFRATSGQGNVDAIEAIRLLLTTTQEGVR